MKQNVTLGVICFARKTFDYKAAFEIYKKILVDLNTIENVQIESIPNLVIEVKEANKAAQILAAKDIDGLVCINGTFHLGHLVLEMLRRIQKPLLLWGLPELPYDGGKIRLNSVCGVILNASNLYKAGIRNYHTVIGNKIDENWVDALRVLNAFKTSRLGIAGFRAKGFFNLGYYDLKLYREMGFLIDHFELSEIWDMPVKSSEKEERKAQLRNTFNVDKITEAQLNKVAELACKFSSFLEKNKIHGLAIRCWPEFSQKYGIAPCASMSFLQSKNQIIACEGDIEGLVSMIAHRAVSGETPYLFDFSQVNFEKNFVVLWHCGVAPCNLWDGVCQRTLSSYHMGGKGVTADFVLKTGEISILRFDSTGTEYRVFLEKAQILPMEKQLLGTYMKARFDTSVKEVLQKIIENGIAHHASAVYGNFIEPFKIVAKIKGWKVI
jgi:L-fucose isomerase-like protein